MKNFKIFFNPLKMTPTKAPIKSIENKVEKT